MRSREDAEGKAGEHSFLAGQVWLSLAGDFLGHTADFSGVSKSSVQESAFCQVPQVMLEVQEPLITGGLGKASRSGTAGDCFSKLGRTDQEKHFSQNHGVRAGKHHVCECVCVRERESCSVISNSACQARLSMEFTKQEYWSRLSFPPLGDLADPGIEPGSPALQAVSLLCEPPGKPSGKHHGHRQHLSCPSCAPSTLPEWVWWQQSANVPEVLTEVILQTVIQSVLMPCLVSAHGIEPEDCLVWPVDDKQREPRTSDRVWAFSSPPLSPPLPHCLTLSHYPGGTSFRVNIFPCHPKIACFSNSWFVFLNKNNIVIIKKSSH